MSFWKKYRALKIDCPILYVLRDDSVLNGIENFSQHASVVKMEEVRNCSDFQVLLSKYQCGFLKVYDALNILPPVIEQWRNSLGEGVAFGALLTDCLS